LHAAAIARQLGALVAVAVACIEQRIGLSAYTNSSLHDLQEFFMANRHCGDGSTLIVQVNRPLL